MKSKRKDQICSLLKGIETGDEAAAEVVNESKYIQHNPQTHEGSEGLAALFKRLSKTSPRVNIVRVFEDGDYVFAHTEYDFANSNIGFEIFRFEGRQAVEHWDNIQRRRGPNPSGHSMVDGPTDSSEKHLTEVNRALVRSFTNIVLVGRQLEKIDDYISNERFTQHNPLISDVLLALREALEASNGKGHLINYERNHRILAEGNFVLSVSEGTYSGNHSAFFDLFRVSDNKLVEHWDTIEAIPPQSEWKNDNGKF
jgi:predicted SnoaL-like aldol condensation-catalyzing enzyme